MDDIVQVDVNVLAWIGGVLCPILTGLVTTKVSSAPLKAIVNAGLAAIVGATAVAIAAQGAVDTSEVLNAVGMAVVAAWASYYGFWKSTGIAGAVQDKTASFGVGARPGVADLSGPVGYEAINEIAARHGVYPEATPVESESGDGAPPHAPVDPE